MEPNISIFTSSANVKEDQAFRDKLQGQLYHRYKRKTIMINDISTLNLGKPRRSEADSCIDGADIVLLIVSPDFIIDPDCCADVEYAMQLSDKDKVRVIPIKFRSVGIENEPYAMLQSLPATQKNEDKWVKKWIDQDEALHNVAKGVSRVIDECLADKTSNEAIIFSDPLMGISTQTEENATNTFVVPPKKKRRRAFYIGTVLCAILLVVGISAYIFEWIPIKDHKSNIPAITVSPTNISPENQLPTGFSVGGTIFDTERADGRLKQEAANSLNTNHLTLAQGFLEMGSEEDSSDAETLIYLENLSIEQSTHAYVTLLVPMRFSSDKASHDVTLNNIRAMLQGVYVAQHTYNTQPKQSTGAPMVRLMLANLGNSPTDARKVIQQVQMFAQREKIVGVVGSPLSISEGADILNSIHIPLISSQVSCDAPAELSNFFSVAPSFKEEVKGIVTYTKMVAKNVAIYYDPSYPTGTGYYGSQCLHDEFMAQSSTDGQYPIPQTYSTGQTDSLRDLASSAKQSLVDLIYFLGPPSDASTLVADLHDINYQDQVKVLGTDMLYQYVYMPISQRQNFEGLYFTSFAFHSIAKWNCLVYTFCNPAWNCTNLAACVPSFFNDYNQTFNPGGHRSPIHYGYTWPDSDSILAYDATSVFLYAYSIASDSSSVSEENILDVLHSITPKKPFAGVSGQISFGSDGYPLDKAVLILRLQTTTQWVMTSEGHY